MSQVSGRVLLVGDIHSDFLSFESLATTVLTRVDGIERIVQVGDFGFWPEEQEWHIYRKSALPVPVFFIDGNHENHLSLRQAALDEPGRVSPMFDAAYIPRGTIEDQILYIGGATSIDRPVRVEGQDWFPEENLTEEQVSVIVHRLREKQVSTIIAHETTRGAFPLIRRPEWAMVDRNRDLLEEVFLAARPRLYVHGHYHFYREYEYLDCRFVSLSNPDRYRREIEQGDESTLLSIARECCLVAETTGDVISF